MANKDVIIQVALDAGDQTPQTESS